MQWATPEALDFTTAETIGADGLQHTQYNLFDIHQNTREFHLAGMTEHPARNWMMQMARNLTDLFDGPLRHRAHVIIDSDGTLCSDFRRTLIEAGCEPVRTPSRSPNLNPHVERWFGSLKREALSRVIPMGDSRLHYLIKEDLAHYKGERLHQGLNNHIPLSMPSIQRGYMDQKTMLGGMLSNYHRAPA